MASLNDSICSFVRQEPRVASEVYDHFAQYPRASVKAAVSKLVRDRKLFRPKLNLAHNDSILSSSPNFIDANLLRKLYDNGFYGRYSVRSLLEHLQYSQPAVMLGEVAKIAALRVGVAPQFNWNESRALIEALEELGIVKEVEISPNDLRWVLNKELFIRAGLRCSDSNLHPAYLSIKETLRMNAIEALSTWLIQNRFVSPSGSCMANSRQPVVSYVFQPFDYLGFCYANGVSTRVKGQKVKPRPFVGDVLFEVCSLPYAKSFKVRIDEATAVGHGQAPMAFIMAKGFHPDAHEYLRTEGIFLWATDQLLGKKTAEAIEKTLALCEGLVRKTNLDPKLFLEALSGFENFGGLFGNIKGKLFEIMMAYFVGKLGYENIQIGRPVPAIVEHEKGETQFDPKAPELDLDVFGSRNSEALLMECKGLAENMAVEDADVTKHFSERTSRMRLFLLRASQNTSKRFKSIVVTSGNFSDTIRKDFESGKFKSREDTKFEIWDRRRLIQQLEEAGQTELIEVLRRFFISAKPGK